MQGRAREKLDKVRLAIKKEKIPTTCQYLLSLYGLLVLRQVGIEPTTYCLEGSKASLSISIIRYIKALIYNNLYSIRKDSFINSHQELYINSRGD